MSRYCRPDAFAAPFDSFDYPPETIGPVKGIEPHICGLSGIGFQCPACAVVRENRAREASELAKRDIPWT